MSDEDDGLEPMNWEDVLFPEANETPPVNGTRPSTGDTSSYVQAAYAGELAELMNTPEGRRNEQLNISAFKIATLVGAGQLDDTDARDSLYRMGIAVGLEHGETLATIASAFEAGTARPRVIPEREPLTPIPEATVFDPSAAMAQRDPCADWRAEWDAEDETDWVLYPLLPARRLVALFSPPKIGKSLLMLELAVAIACGEKVLDRVPDKPHRVLYMDFENDLRGDVVTRLKAMGRKPDELDDLRYWSFPTTLPALDTAQGGFALLARLEEEQADVLVIDTVSRIVQGEENANDTWLAFYRNTGRLLKAAGITTVRLDHTGKDEARGMRGGSAKYGDVDAVWAMSVVGEGQLQLECTANRLPVADKVLLLERHTEPHLHHTAKVGKVAVADAAQAACIAAMEGIGLAAGVSQRDAREAMEEAGLYSTKPGTKSRFAKHLIDTSVTAWKTGPTVMEDLPRPQARYDKDEF